MYAAVGDRDVALVHDYLLVLRGAERTFDAIARCWPRADVHTLLYDADATGGRFEQRRVRPSPLQALGIRQDGFRRLLPLFPAAASRLDLGDARVVVSSSSAFAHGVRPPAGATHICYCHSPFRYVWHERHRAMQEFPGALRSVGRALLDRLREWDLEASERVTHYIANSRITQERIAEFYGRESTILHPPVEIDRFHVAEPEDYFLVVCELVAHKNVDIALAAAAKAGARVKVVGSGPEEARLRTGYGGHVEFLGRVGDRELEHLYARCRALLVPAVEEFGIVVVEAMASGRPVVAAAKGGALEIITPQTGVLVPVRDVDALAEALLYTDFDAFDPDRLVRRAQRFSTEMFQLRLTTEVERLVGGGYDAPVELGPPLTAAEGRFTRAPRKSTTR